VPEPDDHTPILILTGPPGVGKTTTAGLVTERSARAVHLESDAFFHFIRSGYVEQLWRSFSDLGDLERNVINLDSESPEATAETLEERMADGSLLV
jgi:adenylate kinase family enzyme